MQMRTEYQIEMLKASCDWAMSMAWFYGLPRGSYFVNAQCRVVERIATDAFRVIDRGAAYDHR